MVLLIAFLHGLAVLVATAYYKNRYAVIYAGILSAVIASVTGSPVFFIADLVGVGLGVWLSLRYLETLEKGRQLEAEQREEADQISELNKILAENERMFTDIYNDFFICKKHIYDNWYHNALISMRLTNGTLSAFQCSDELFTLDDKDLVEDIIAVTLNKGVSQILRAKIPSSVSVKGI